MAIETIELVCDLCRKNPAKETVEIAREFLFVCKECKEKQNGQAKEAENADKLLDAKV